MIRRVHPDELERMAEIDRSEHITRAYEVTDGDLNELEVDWHVPAWEMDGAGDHSVAAQVAFCRAHLDRGGMMLGAFHDADMVGIAVVRPRLREGLAQLAFLHVSRRMRRRGIAKRLMCDACEIARVAGATQLYVSSTPSSSAVGFYRAQGCRLAEAPDPELYALEPEDVHLIMDL